MASPASEERIAAAERELGVRLMIEHRARLARNNGGEVICEGSAWRLHPVWDDTDRRTAARTASHIVHETREARAWSGFPDDAVAIASDGSGDVLIVRAGTTYVEHWEHETGACVRVEVDWSH